MVEHAGAHYVGIQRPLYRGMKPYVVFQTRRRGPSLMLAIEPGLGTETIRRKILESEERYRGC
jgi:hypothetical protein